MRKAKRRGRKFMFFQNLSRGMKKNKRVKKPKGLAQSCDCSLLYLFTFLPFYLFNILEVVLLYVLKVAISAHLQVIGGSLITHDNAVLVHLKHANRPHLCH